MPILFFRRVLGFGRGTFERQICLFSGLIKVRYLRGDNCLQNANLCKQKGSCSKTPLNWTGSVFPLLSVSHFWGFSEHLECILGCYPVLSLDGLKLCKFVPRSDLVPWIFYPISFSRRASRFVAFQTKVARSCFCLVCIQMRSLTCAKSQTATQRKI